MSRAGDPSALTLVSLTLLSDCPGVCFFLHFPSLLHLQSLFALLNLDFFFQRLCNRTGSQVCDQLADSQLISLCHTRRLCSNQKALGHSTSRAGPGVAGGRRGRRAAYDWVSRLKIAQLLETSACQKPREPRARGLCSSTAGPSAARVRCLFFQSDWAIEAAL